MLDAIAAGRTDLVFEHLAAGGAATASAAGVPLLRWCAYYGDVSAIRFLVERGETLATLGDNLDLDEAAFHGHWRLCEYLLEQGADPNAALPDTGEVPLHAALCKRESAAHELVVEVLLARGADPKRATRPGVETGGFMRDARTRGETPLHRAAAFGTERAIRLLLDAGAELDARDAHGDSPLSWASWHLRPAHVLALLCFGEHRIHPDAVAASRAGAGGMARNLLGRPRSGGGESG